MTDERKAQLEKAWEEVQRRQCSNAENLDRALLTLSSTGLAVSVAAIKNVIVLETATHLSILHLSWGLFVLSIFATLVSYGPSQWGLKTQLTSIENKLLKRPNDPKLAKKVDRMFYIATGMSVLSCGAYFVAILLTICFIKINL